MLRGERLRVAGTDCWVRTAADPDGVAHLVAVATTLASLRHPGIVDLVAVHTEDGRTRLVTRWAGQPVLERPPDTAGEVAGLGAAAATTLADIHALGWAHGAVRADHLLVAEDGRPVWCGLGSATTDPMHQTGDAERLLDLLDQLAGLLPEPGRALPRTLRRCRRRPSVEDIARRLADPQLGPCLPGQAPTVPAGQQVTRTARTRQLRRVAAAAAVLLAGLAAVGHWTSHPRAAVGCPAVDRGCLALAAPGGVLAVGSHRYALGVAPATVLLGRWRCDGVALPAVLDERTGRVWAWDAWATEGSGVPARLLGQVPHATGLRLLPGLHGCDRLLVTVAGGRPVPLRPGAPV